MAGRASWLFATSWGVILEGEVTTAVRVTVLVETEAVRRAWGRALTPDAELPRPAQAVARPPSRGPRPSPGAPGSRGDSPARGTCSGLSVLLKPQLHVRAIMKTRCQTGTVDNC